MSEIKVAEPNSPQSDVTRGKRVLKKALVAKIKVLKFSDHDFYTISLTPAGILVHDLTCTIDNSWYRSIQYIYVKIHVTEPLTALQNAREIADVLIHFGSNKVPPVLLYTDGGPGRWSRASIQLHIG